MSHPPDALTDPDEIEHAHTSSRIPAAAGAMTPCPPTSSGDTPEAAFARYVGLINTHDFDRLAREVIAPDAIFVFSDEIHRGLDAVRASFRGAWTLLPDEVYTMSEPEWIRRDAQSAACTFRYAFVGTTLTGRRLDGAGRGMNILARRPEGWRVQYEQLSPDLKPRS